MANCKLSVWWSFICIIELYMIWAYCMYNRNVLILQQVRNPTPAAALTYQVCLWVCSFWVLLQTSSATTPTRKHWTLHQNYFKFILWDNPVFHQKPVLPFHIKTYFKFIFWNSTVFHQAHIFFFYSCSICRPYTGEQGKCCTAIHVENVPSMAGMPRLSSHSADLNSSHHHGVNTNPSDVLHFCI